MRYQKNKLVIFLETFRPGHVGSSPKTATHVAGKPTQLIRWGDLQPSSGHFCDTIRNGGQQTTKQNNL
jgi:hypothetical protein